MAGNAIRSAAVTHCVAHQLDVPQTDGSNVSYAQPVNATNSGWKANTKKPTKTSAACARAKRLTRPYGVAAGEPGAERQPADEDHEHHCLPVRGVPEIVAQV